MGLSSAGLEASEMRVEDWGVDMGSLRRIMERGCSWRALRLVITSETLTAIMKWFEVEVRVCL